jgi:putative tryptophan/tyrosine transport system substrate-binding protein
MRGMTRSLILAATFVLVIITWADAQSQTGKIPRVGILGGSSADAAKRNIDAFRDEMRELGWVEGKNIVFEYRHADGDLSRLAGFAAELVKLNVDIILAAGSQSTAAAKQATATIPIVAGAAGDLVGAGWCKAWRAQVAISRVPPSYLLT